MDELIGDFLVETNENLVTLDVEILKLEQNPTDQTLLGGIFRMMHTIKGTCGFLGLGRLEAVAHAGENVLGKIRDGDISATPKLISLILKSIDKIKEILEVIAATEKEPEGNDAELIALLNKAAADPSILETIQIDAAISAAAPTEPAPAQAPAVVEVAPVVPIVPAAPVPEVKAAQPDEFGFVPVRVDSTASAAAPAPEVKAEEPDEFGFVPVKVDAVAAPTPTAHAEVPKVENKQEVKKDDKQAGAHGAAPTQSAGSIRVSVEVLEGLMQMVSELVLTRNQLAQITRANQDSEFTVPIQRLNLITSELQEKVMKTRMQPISNAWVQFPRMVRDLAMDLGKKIELKMIGEETELDRQLIESIKDPLTHMVRNSADHGIETIEGRRAAHKSDHGTITLKAYHQGGHIILEISDDGRGLNIGKIKEKALKNGIATEAELAAMTDQQIMQYIFKAGFSTAEKVTSISGRGVGMDVVKTNIEKISGNIEMKSIEGKGSTFVIKIPLTLAIMSILIVECRGEKFGVPQINILEMVRTGANSEYSVEKINDHKVLRLRDKLLPLVALEQVLGFDDIQSSKDTNYIVVCEIGGCNFGVIVDRIFDTEEIVVKPVAPVLKQIEIYSGSTLLGDGRVIMILDPNALAKSVGEIRMSSDHGHGKDESLAASNASEYATFLLIKANDDTYKAVPLELVSRLEEIDVSKIEYSAGKPVVQYRDNLIYLVKLEENYAIPESGMQQVIVFSCRDNIMGLVVKEVMDIVEHKMHSIHPTKKDGLIGALVINEKTTDLIDITVYFQKAFGVEFSIEDEDEENENLSSILLVDDSPFFRKFIPPLLRREGYNVIPASNAGAAFDLIETNDFRAIITDLNMPGMDGLEFANTLKMSQKSKDIPIIALSSTEKGRQKKSDTDNFSGFVSKTNHTELIKIIKSL